MLVTGAGGSIGSCLARYLREWQAEQVVLVDNHEHSLYQLQVGLGREANLHYHLADVRLEGSFARVVQRYRPEVIFHLAAYKHVPLGEENPGEAVLTNVLGTQQVLAAAAEAGTGLLVYSSTDKAVYPPSVYGATKRVIELMLTSFARAHRGTNCAVVRLVNAVGAQGGVIRLFRDQLLANQALTITDERMTRYWISIEEAALLVAQAAASSGNADLIIPDSGPALPLVTIAERLRDLVCPGREIRYHHTGLRPGERLEEYLLREDETAEPLPFPAVLAVRDRHADRPDLDTVMAEVLDLQRCVAAGTEGELRRRVFALAQA